MEGARRVPGWTPVDFLILRHGQTTWNARGIIQGQADAPLDDVGRAQARALSWLGAARDGDAWGGTHPRRAVSAVGRTAEAEMVMAAIVRAFVRGAREVAAGDARRPSSLGRFFGCGQKNFRVAG
jgi:probable phosphoglycerate mutase